MRPLTLSRRTRVLLGSAVWLAVALAAGALVAAPGVRLPLARTVLALSDGLLEAPERERDFPVADARGVEAGEPVFLASQERIDAPVGHVVRIVPTREGALGAAMLRVRFAPGFELHGDLRFTCLPPSRTFAEAVSLAVPPATARLLGEALRERLEATFSEAVGPELEARLPAFLARVDPTKDPRTGAEVKALAHAVLERLRPLLDGLTRDVTRAVDKRFDLLGRLGLLWKMLRGDGEGLRKDLLPVAQQAATTWWETHASEVLEAVGTGVKDREAELGAWLKGPLWETARDELLLPVARSQRARLEAEAEALLARALTEIVLAPGGGLRPRFASVVRTHLLGQATPLLLVERGPDSGNLAQPGAGR
jgi:hypothetical protein